MPVETRYFELHNSIKLPHDTAIIPVPTVRQIPGTATEMTSPQSAGAAGQACTSCNSNGDVNEEPDDLAPESYLVVSPSAASYFLVEGELIPPLKALIAGETLENAILSYGATSRRKATSSVARLLKHIEFRNFYSSVLPEEHVPDGAMLHIYVTNKCNLRCKHCYMNSGNKLPQGEVSTSERIKAIQTFSALHPGGLVTFSGGEALLDPDIFVLLRESKSLGLRTELFTNGLPITSENIGVISELVDDLQVSLDGATKKIHEEIRGKRTFNKTLRVIRTLDKAAQSRTAFRYRVSFTLTPSNWRDIRTNLRQLLRRLDLRAVSRILVGAGSGVGRAAKNSRMYSNVEEMRKIESAVMHHLAKTGIVRLPIFSTNRFSRTCGQGATISVGADGNIYPCNITDQPAIGNMRDSQASDIMRSVNTYIKSTSVDEVEGCNKCAIRYFCGGICRITNLRRTGSFNKSACTPEYKAAQIRSLARRYQSFEMSAREYEQEAPKSGEQHPENRAAHADRRPRPGGVSQSH